MSQSLEAVFDGTVLQPDTPLNLQAGTRVRITLEIIDAEPIRPNQSFLQTARSLQLEGPPDWSEKLDHYLYGIDMPQNG